MGIKFIFVIVIAVLVTIAVSFIWPRISTRPRPEVLTRVKDFIASTPIGPTVTNVLGVSSEENMRPINIREVASNAATVTVNSVREYAANALFLSAVRQLAGQYNKLKPEQQKEVRDLICTPAAEESVPGTPAP